MTLDEFEAALKANAANFAGLGGLVRFDFANDGQLFIDGRQEPPTVSRTAEGDPKTTLAIPLPELVKIYRGESNPMMAFTTGKLKVNGDMGLAMRLGNMLED